MKNRFPELVTPWGTQRGANEDEHREGGNGVRGDPFAGEGEAEQYPDDRHGHPERPAGAPHAGPQRGKERVGGHEEEPHVHVVHGDSRLNEEHAVGQ
jgi:hypothetical protein